jgi:tetratricopeptide (TPR) repeat protein
MPKDLTLGSGQIGSVRFDGQPPYDRSEIPRFAIKGLLCSGRLALSEQSKGTVSKVLDEIHLGSGSADSQLSAVVVLRGPFRLLTSDGRDVTPESPLRQAILAVLATAPKQVKARKTLQDMFWSEADAVRASANLRTALYLLRRDLLMIGSDVLRADRQAVSLAPGAIRAEIGPSNSGSLLEGLDVGLAACEAFEDWLRELRHADDDAAQEKPPIVGPRAQAPVGVSLGRARSHLALGLLPAVYDVLSQADHLRVVGFTDSIAAFIRQTTLLDIHDLRGLEGHVVPLPLESGLGATHWLQAVVEKSGKQLVLRLRLLDGASRKLLWISEPIGGGQLPDVDLACSIAEIVLDRLQGSAEDSWQPNLFPLTAISALFSLDSHLVAETDMHLKRLQDQGGPPFLECLRLFAQVFIVNEALGQPEVLDVESVCAALGRMAASDPMLPLCQSIVGYSLHMLFARNDQARHLLETARDNAPNLALNLDHLAVIRLMSGDLEGAEEAFRHCLRAGSFSPWRYTYELTGAMVCLAKGDYRQSLYFANQSMFRQPRYLAALRYSMTSFALSGRSDDARLMHQRILRLRPNLDLSDWAEGMLRRTPAELGSAIIGGLRAAAIL